MLPGVRHPGDPFQRVRPHPGNERPACRNGPPFNLPPLGAVKLERELARIGESEVNLAAGRLRQEARGRHEHRTTSVDLVPLAVHA